MSGPTALVSMSGRHPDGRDEEYLAWHALDHVPELHRLPDLRAALRLVSTPECRAARAASSERYDAVEHVMTYLLASRAGVGRLGALAADLAAAGRLPMSLPSVEVGVYDLVATAVSPGAGVAADVIPWRPAQGAYLLVEAESAPAAALTEVAGVAGAWWYADDAGTQLTFCYLDDHPVETARRLGDALAARWASGAVTPLLAAPFHTVVPYAWGRFLP
ncbi:MAG: hypothetical protein ABWZ76_05840 [Acidimicrobiales bacterium]